MTKDETKAWLRSYRQKKLEADHLDRMIQKLEAEIYSPKTTRFDKIPGCTPDAGSPTERLALKHLELVDKYKAMRDELLDGQREIEKAIESLGGSSRTMMRLYYMEGLTWEAVAVAINYSWRQTHNLHSAALNKLAAQTEEEPEAPDLEPYDEDRFGGFR